MKIINSLIVGILITSFFIPMVYAENLDNSINVNLQNKDDSVNIDNYNFKNPFSSLGDAYKGIYFGNYFPSSQYIPYVSGDTISYNIEVNISDDIIPSAFTEFYIISIFSNENNQSFYVNEYEIKDYEIIDDKYIYHVKGVYETGIYTFKFITSNINAIIDISAENIGYTYLKIDNYIYDVAYNLAFKMLIVNGGNKDLSIIEYELDPGEEIFIENYDLNVVVPLNNTQLYIPCTSTDFYDYTITLVTDWYSFLWKYSTNNHHLVVNNTLHSPASKITGYTIKITNNNDHPIKINLYFNHFKNTTFKKYTSEHGWQNDIMKGGLIHWIKSIGTGNDAYNKLWSMVDLYNYNEKSKVEYLNYFSNIHTIIDIENHIYSDTTISNNIKQSINVRLSNFLNNSKNGVNDIIGNFDEWGNVLFESINNMGKMIQQFTLDFIGVFITLIKEIINVFENLLEYVILPAIALISFYVAVMGMGNIILEIKKVGVKA